MFQFKDGSQPRKANQFTSKNLAWRASSARLLCDAGIAQLVEHNLAKVGVAGSSPVSRFQEGSVNSGTLLAVAVAF